MSTLPSLFRDRTDAGEQLAQAIHAILTQSATDFGSAKPIVYALPRGGLPVAAPVARLLRCPLDIVVAKKISHPKNPELAIGAVSASGQLLWTTTPLPTRRQHSREQEDRRQEAINQAQSQLAQLTPACPQVNIEGALAILVDDGIATGMTMAVAAKALKAQQPAAVWICAPVAPASLLPWLRQWGDCIIVLETPELFLSVSRFYTEFPQVEIEEAFCYLQQQNDWLAGNREC